MCVSQHSLATTHARCTAVQQHHLAIIEKCPHPVLLDVAHIVAAASVLAQVTNKAYKLVLAGAVIHSRTGARSSRRRAGCRCTADGLSNLRCIAAEGNRQGARGRGAGEESSQSMVRMEIKLRRATVASKLQAGSR